MMLISSLEKRFGRALLEHKLMRDYTKLKTGGVVDFLVQAKTIQELIDAVKICQRENLDYLLIGQGNNILFSDYGFPGIVIQNLSSNISYVPNSSQIIVDSGVDSAKLVYNVANRNLGGIEFLVDVAGTVGGIIYNNLGSGKNKLSQLIKRITVLNEANEIETFSPSQLYFGNYNSTFRKKSKKYTILTVTLQLRSNRQEDIVRKIQEIKPRKLEKGVVSGNIFLDIPGKNIHELIKISEANKLSESDAGIASQNYNRLLNKGSAKAIDFRTLIEEIRKKVAEKTGVVLEEGIEFFGVW